MGVLLSDNWDLWSDRANFVLPKWNPKFNGFYLRGNLFSNHGFFVVWILKIWPQAHFKVRRGSVESV